VTQLITLLAYTQKACFESRIGHGFSWFSSFLQLNAMIRSHTRPRPLTSTFCAIHYSLSSFHLMLSRLDMLTVLFKPFRETINMHWFICRYQEIPVSHVNSATASVTRQHASCKNVHCK
jgi:hypothetical protein